MSQFFWLIFTLGLVQLLSRLDLENETNKNYARVGFAVATLIQLFVYLYVRNVITKKKDTTKLRYAKPTSPFESFGRTDDNSAVPETIITTNEEYDLEKVTEAIKQILMTACIISFLNYQYEFVRPLVLQSILPFRQLYSNQLVQIHLLKKEATGPLERPFKQPSMFDAFGGGLKTPAPPTGSSKKAVEDSKKKE